MLRAIGILLLATAPLHAQGSLAEIVSPSTPVLIEIDDLGGYEEWTKNSALGRIWVEPEVQQFWSGLKRAIAKGVASQRARGPDFFMMAGLEPDDFLGIEVRRAGVALCGVKENRPVVVLNVELRKGVEKVQKIMRQFRMAFGMFLGAAWELEKAGEVEIWHVTMGDDEYAHAIVGNRLLVTTGRPLLKQTLALINGARMPRLAGEATFRATLAAMDAKRYGVLCYVNAPAVYRQVMPYLGRQQQREADAVMAATGLDAVEAIALADIPAGTNLRTEFCIKLKERRGFFSLFQAAPTTHKFADRVPHDALFYGAERFDASRFMNDLVTWIDRVEPGAAQEYREILGRYNRVMGIDLERDFLGSLGDEWAAYFGGTPGGSLIPDAVMMISLKDRARFEKSVRAMVESYPDVLRMYEVEGAASVRHRRTNFAGRDIHLLELADRRGNPIPIVPSWTVADDHVALALSPQALKHLLTKRATLKSHEGFARVAALAPSGAASQGYFDLPRVAVFAHNSLVPLLQGMQGAIDRKLARFDISVNLHDLPRAEVIRKHLSACVSYTKVEDGAIRMGYVSPCGVSFLIAPAVSLGVAAALVEEGMREERRERDARTHLLLENEKLQELLKAERARWAARIRKLEVQLAELKKLIEEQR